MILGGNPAATAGGAGGAGGGGGGAAAAAPRMTPVETTPPIPGYWTMGGGTATTGAWVRRWGRWTGITNMSFEEPG